MNVGIMSRKKLFCVNNRDETKIVPLCGKLFHPLRYAQYPLPSGISSCFTFMKARDEHLINSKTNGKYRILLEYLELYCLKVRENFWKVKFISLKIV